MLGKLMESWQDVKQIIDAVERINANNDVTQVITTIKKIHSNLTFSAVSGSKQSAQTPQSVSVGSPNQAFGRSSRAKVSNALLSFGPPPATAIAHHPHSSRGLFVRLERGLATSVLISYPGQYALIPLSDVPTSWFEPEDQQGIALAVRIRRPPLRTAMKIEVLEVEFL